MAQQLKRWESPRRTGRNHKGRGGCAKQRQYKKRQKLLMKRLKKGIEASRLTQADPANSCLDVTTSSPTISGRSPQKREAHELPFFVASFRVRGHTPCLVKGE